jgi:hypothetical protein
MGDCVFRGTATRSGEVSTCDVIIPKSVGHRSVWEPGIPGLEPMATDFKFYRVDATRFMTQHPT